MLRRVLSAACVAGFVSGLLLSALQQWQVVPLLRAAEVYETEHDHAASAERAAVVETRAFDGWEAPATLAAANVALGVGFALILAGVSSLRRSEGWRAGALWGLAGYIVFFVAPSLGLPPTLPGVPIAPLGPRTAWWLFAVGCSAGGLWLIVFARPVPLRALGIALLLVPHAIGAPRLDAPSSLVPAELSRGFVRATYLCNAVFWVLIGTLVGVGLAFSRTPPRAEAERRG